MARKYITSAFTAPPPQIPLQSTIRQPKQLLLISSSVTSKGPPLFLSLPLSLSTTILSSRVHGLLFVLAERRCVVRGRRWPTLTVYASALYVLSLTRDRIKSLLHQQQSVLIITWLPPSELLSSKYNWRKLQFRYQQGSLKEFLVYYTYSRTQLYFT